MLYIKGVASLSFPGVTVSPQTSWSSEYKFFPQVFLDVSYALGLLSVFKIYMHTWDCKEHVLWKQPNEGDKLKVLVYIEEKLRPSMSPSTGCRKKNQIMAGNVDYLAPQGSALISRATKQGRGGVCISSGLTYFSSFKSNISK